MTNEDLVLLIYVFFSMALVIVLSIRWWDARNKFWAARRRQDAQEGPASAREGPQSIKSRGWDTNE